jgi:hypothetical protein
MVSVASTRTKPKAAQLTTTSPTQVTRHGSPVPRGEPPLPDLREVLQMRSNDVHCSFDKNLSGDRNVLMHSQDGLLREVVLRSKVVEQEMLVAKAAIRNVDTGEYVFQPVLIESDSVTVACAPFIAVECPASVLRLTGVGTGAEVNRAPGKVYVRLGHGQAHGGRQSGAVRRAATRGGRIAQRSDSEGARHPHPLAKRMHGGLDVSSGDAAHPTFRDNVRLCGPRRVDRPLRAHSACGHFR